MIAFLLGLLAGVSIGFVLGAVWMGLMEQRHNAELMDRWSYHGYGPPEDDEPYGRRTRYEGQLDGRTDEHLDEEDR